MSPLVRFVVLTATSVPTLLASFSGCQVVAGYEEFEAKPPHPCDSLPAEKPDQRELARMVLSKQSDGSCHWIDKTEVTVEQYSAFLSDTRNSPVAWGEECAWKTSPSDPVRETSHECTREAAKESEPFRPAKPIRCLDWCDARAFCQWAGKELCGGSTAGGGVFPTDLPDQWGNACSESGLKFPYGDGTTPESGVCNLGLSDAECVELARQYRCAPVEVGSFRECSGPHGELDMLGNVAEWVLNCGAVPQGDPAAQRCRYRGGSFASKLQEITCYTLPNALRPSRLPDLGMRCCSQLTAAERTLVNPATRP